MNKSKAKDRFFLAITAVGVVLLIIFYLYFAIEIMEFSLTYTGFIFNLLFVLIVSIWIALGISKEVELNKRVLPITTSIMACILYFSITFLMSRLGLISLGWLYDRIYRKTILDIIYAGILIT